MTLRLTAALFAVTLNAAVPALAQIMSSGPEQYVVSGVASNDVLYVRRGPGTEFAIEGAFEHDATAVEVLELSEDGGWGLVGLPEGNGWVSMRFLAPAPFNGPGLRRPMQCVGTEPFWSLQLDDSLARFDTPLGEVPTLEILIEQEAGNGFLFEAQQSGVASVTLIGQNGECGDGMSDRRFGLQATLFYQDPVSSLVFNGCCTVGRLPTRY